MPAHRDKGMTNDKIHGLSSKVKRKLEVTQCSFELILYSRYGRYIDVISKKRRFSKENDVVV